MTANGESTVAPLRAWGAAGAISLMIVGCAWLIWAAIGPLPSRDFIEFNRARIVEFGAQPYMKGSATVLMIGSSVLKYATRTEADFAEAVSLATGRQVRVLRVVSNGGSFSNLVPLLGDFQSLHPDVLVMQRDQLVYERPRNGAFAVSVERAREWLGIVNEQNLEKPTLQAEIQFEYPCWKRAVVAKRNVDEHIQNRDQWVDIRPDGPSASAARELVQSVLGQGGFVALVDLPRRPDYDAMARPDRDAAIDELELERIWPRINLWDHGAMAIDMYCDVSHVTREGQAIFSSWLEANVAAAVSRIGQ